MSDKRIDYYKKIQNAVNNVSPSFCVAKWKQVTIHLQTGLTHSCHHPTPHKVPLDEIAENPSALHNTLLKKHTRKMMLDGLRPQECDYCWRVEDAPGDHFSDRVKKSAEHWGHEYIPIIPKDSWDANTLPSYVEVSFSNVCNFSCSYCSPDISSGVMQQVKRHGPIQLTDTVTHDLGGLKNIGRFPIPIRQHNPYVEAWWKWWPELYPALKVFRITGGEPLLSKETFRTLDWVIEHPNPNLELAINTNLCVPDDVLRKFLDKCKIINDNKSVKRLKLFTSCDTWGRDAEYIRTGMDYKKWYQNLWDICLNHTYLQPTIMITFSLLSIPHFKEYLQDMLSIRRSPTVPQLEQHPHGAMLDFPYLRNPRYLSPLIADQPMIDLLESNYQFMLDNKTTDKTFYHDGFYPHEIENFRRLINVLKAEDPNSEENALARTDFYMYIKQHDQRNETNFFDVFPSLTDFYQRCEKEYNERISRR